MIDELMKRVCCAVVFIVLLATGVQPVIAQTATKTPTPTATLGPLPTGIPVTVGLENQTVELSNQSETSASDRATIQIPVVGAKTGDEFNVPDLSKVSAMLKNSAPYLVPYTVQQNTKNEETNLYISGQSTHCVYRTKNGVTTVTKDTQPYKTQIVPELSEIDQATRQIAPALTNYSLKKINGTYDFTRDPLVLSVAPECDASDNVEAEQQTAVAVQTAQGFSFSDIIAWFTNLFSGNTVGARSVLLSKQTTPYTDSSHCLLGGCKNDAVDLSYLKTDEEKKNVQQAGGMARAYAPVSHDPTQGELNGAQDNSIGKTSVETRTAYTKAMENAANYIACSVLPASRRSLFGMTDKNCLQPATPDTNCTTGSLPEFTVKPECKLKKNSFNLTDKFIKTIEAAASAYNVPSSLMLAVIYGEGSFNSDSIFIIPAVDTYLDGCTPLPNCDPNATVVNNIVPYFKSNWTDVADAVKIIDPNRKPDACNLTDGIFSLAKTLHRFQFAPAFAGKKCFGINLVSTSDGTAQSCGDWKDPNAESAIRFWEFGNGWDDTTKSCATKLNSCALGGGLSAQCPTGGDTCETVGTRYSSQKSHNGCVWDVYKNN